MIIRKSFVVLGMFIGLVTGCGGESFDGSYLAEPSKDGAPVMNIDGDRALLVLIDRQTSEFKWAARFDVSYKEEKMFLDVDGGGPRFVYGRGVDERGLECLNCEDFRRTPMPTKWAYLPEHFDLEAGLKEQEEEERVRQEEEEKNFLKQKEEEEKAAAEANVQAKAKAEAGLARIEDEKKELGPFEGAWVKLQQPRTLTSLVTWFIDRDSGLTQRIYHRGSTQRMSEYEMIFEVTDGELVWILPRQENKSYKINAEGNQLRCSTCARDEVWLKIDPDKYNDRSYLEEVATQLL